MFSVKLSFIFILAWTAEGINVNSAEGVNVNSADLPIKTIFKLPSPLPPWPPGGDFATGVIDLGGLHVRQVLNFRDSWATNNGGHDDIGVTFFHPTSIPDGFSMLGAYAQPNNQPLFGMVLVGKTNATDGSGPILKPPIDYTLLANTAQNATYFWLPTPPNGFMPVGLVVTASADKPSLDEIRCVRSDFTDEPETDTWIWGERGNGLNAFSLRPKARGTKAQAVSVGSFIVQTNNRSTTLPVACLRNKNPSSNSNSNPNLDQIKALFKTYSPYIYFHPDEIYLPSSVNWFFLNGALLYQRGNESNPYQIEQSGSSLPQGGSNDGSYWMDIPPDPQVRDELKRGDGQMAGPVYLHVKPVLGSTCTDIQIWIFYPFNGHGVLKFGPIERIKLGRVGEHVGDWEHVTLRISNFDGALQKVYFAQHAGGEWVDAPAVEYRDGNKVVAYSSLNGHASYSRAGLVLLGGGKGVGIRDDAAMGDLRMDTGMNYSVAAAEGLSAEEAVAEPAWLNYSREWGPKIAYDFEAEVRAVEALLIRPLRKLFRKLMAKLPPEFYGEEGPTGPKMKSNWDGDEI